MLKTVYARPLLPAANHTPNIVETSTGVPDELF
jgi:hypothetical protein